MDSLLANAFGLDASQLAAEERQRLLSRLLSRLAHEVRNPLSSLDVNVQLLEEDLGRISPPVAPAVRNRLDIIRHELTRLDGIVRHFLTLAGPSSVTLQPMDLRGALDHVCGLLQPEAETRGIQLRATMREAVPELWADPGQLTQAIVNLVINAIQAVQPAGTVEILAFAEKDHGNACIQVCDTGPGVAPDRRLAIFEPFYTTKPEGSGLGLWIVQQIALAHHGSIAAADAPGGGAVFTLRIPLRPARPA